jgi:DNA-binding HxlR family transcriptional regulator
MGSGKRKVLCPAELTLQIIGGRWKGLILWHLLFSSRRFGELRKIVSEGTITQVSKISPKILSQQLKELENDGIIVRSDHSTKKKAHVEYAMSEKGRTLQPILESIYDWGMVERERLGIKKNTGIRYPYQEGNLEVTKM